MAYHEHPEWGRCCAACLLDLMNIGEVLWKWKDYPLIWARMESLIAKSTTTKKKTKPSLEKTQDQDGNSLGGWSHE